MSNDADEIIDTPDPAAAPEAVEVNDEAELLAAMDAGVESATQQPSEDADEEVATVVEEPVPGTPEAAAAETAAEEAAAAGADAAAPDKDTEDEIAALGLKEKSAERFRGMAAEIKALAPIKAQLEAAGIKDVAELPELAQRAKDGADLVEMVSSTGMSPDDFSRLLDYGGTIAAARSGDRAAVERAFEEVGKEYAAIAKALGKEIPGVFDPLAAYPDLAEQVESGDVTRAAALELAGARNHRQAAQQQQEQAEDQRRTQQGLQAAQQQGVASLVQWEQSVIAKDPTYPAKREALNAEVAKIRQNYPPSQWAAMTEYAYRAIPAPAAAPAKPASNAIRPTGHSRMAPATFDSVEDALDFGISQASAG